MLYFCEFSSKKYLTTTKVRKNLEKRYEKHSNCGLVFVLHLMKEDENAKYLYKFRKLNQIRTTCI